MNTKWEWGAEEKRKGDDGFNNAGILTFNSHAVNSFVRELVQNSNDAKADGQKKILIDIELRNIRKVDIPAIDQYEELLHLVQESHPSQRKFFSTAQRILENDTIPFLVYSDYNTKGLAGADDDYDSSFAACVLSEGKSVKGTKTAGGSYGIGKNAIYGVSALRTVFYSSLSIDRNPIFQGVAKIASYKKNGKNHEGRIYLGQGEDLSSIRDTKKIPEIFRRQVPGLSQFVMGVELEPDWHTDFARALLRNYWMLLVDDKLEVNLRKDGEVLASISCKNAPSLLETYFGEEEDWTLAPYGNPFLFYRAFRDGEKREFDIPHIGRCCFHYLQSEEGENNVAYIRNGMVVLSKIEKRLPGANVSGVFYCANEAGNEILRRMEPPKHDSFEPEMLVVNDDHLSRKDGEKIVKSIKSNIRQVIRELIDKYKEEVETPAFLTELFDDLHKSIAPGTAGNRTGHIGTHETLHKIPAEETFAVTLASEETNSVVSTSSGIQDVGSGEVTGSNPSGERSKTKGGFGTKGGSTERGKSPKRPITSRIFHYQTQNGRNIYRALIFSERDLGKIELSVSQHGDSGNDVAFQLHTVQSESGGNASFVEVRDEVGLVTEYKLLLDIKGGSNSFLLEISDNQKSAFTIRG